MSCKISLFKMRSSIIYWGFVKVGIGLGQNEVGPDSVEEVEVVIQ